MEYTLWNVILLNIPLVLAEYVCCMILTRGLTKCRPQGKAAVLMLLPYSLLLILPSSVFYLHDLFGEVSALLALSLLETAGWTVTLRAAGRIRQMDENVGIIFLTTLTQYGLEGYKYQAAKQSIVERLRAAD